MEAIFEITSIVRQLAAEQAIIFNVKPKQSWPGTKER